MKSVLFLSNQHRYLCNRIYVAIASHLPKYKKVYLDAELFKEIQYEISFEADKKSLADTVNEYVLLNNPSDQSNSNVKLKRYQQQLVILRRWRSSLIKKVKEINPAIIICISDGNPSYKVLKSVFGKFTPFVFVQHGQIQQYKSINPFRKRWKDDLLYKIGLGVKLSRKSNVIAGEDASNYLLFWSKEWTKHFPDDRNIRHVGAINYDSIFKTNYSIKRQEYKKQLGLDENKPVVVIALNKSKNIGLKVFKQFAEGYTQTIKAFPGVQFILKVHPVVDIDFCKRIHKSEEISNARFVKEMDWDSLLHVSDIFVTHWSSTLYFAMAANIPTVMFIPISKDYLKNFNLENFAFIASNVRDLNKYLNLFLSEKGYDTFNAFRNKFVEERMLNSDGNSAKRASLAIEEIIEMTSLKVHNKYPIKQDTI